MTNEIRIQELRIGNIVNVTKEIQEDVYLELDIDMCKGYYEVDSISKDEVVLIIDKNKTEFEYSEIKPIPLTEEWIKRCKFNFKKLELEDLAVSIGLISGEIHFVIGNYHKELKYLHQLQNIYFYFTEKELIIK